MCVSTEMYLWVNQREPYCRLGDPKATEPECAKVCPGFCNTLFPFKGKKKCHIGESPLGIPSQAPLPNHAPEPSTILSDIDHPYLLSWGVACLDNTAQIAEINQKQSSYQHPQGAKLHKTSASQKEKGGKKEIQRKSEGKEIKTRNQTNNAGKKKKERNRERNRDNERMARA